MTRKQTERATERPPADFKAVAWVRTVRDGMYEATRDMSPEQFAEYVALRAAKMRRQAKSS